MRPRPPIAESRISGCSHFNKGTNNLIKSLAFTFPYDAECFKSDELDQLVHRELSGAVRLVETLEFESVV